MPNDINQLHRNLRGEDMHPLFAFTVPKIADAVVSEKHVLGIVVKETSTGKIFELIDRGGAFDENTGKAVPPTWRPLLGSTSELFDANGKLKSEYMNTAQFLDYKGLAQTQAQLDALVGDTVGDRAGLLSVSFNPLSIAIIEYEWVLNAATNKFSWVKSDKQTDLSDFMRLSEYINEQGFVKKEKLPSDTVYDTNIFKVVSGEKKIKDGLIDFPTSYDDSAIKQKIADIDVILAADDVNLNTMQKHIDKLKELTDKYNSIGSSDVRIETDTQTVTVNSGKSLRDNTPLQYNNVNTDTGIVTTKAGSWDIIELGFEDRGTVVSAVIIDIDWDKEPTYIKIYDGGTWHSFATGKGINTVTLDAPAHKIEAKVPTGSNLKIRRVKAYKKGVQPTYTDATVYYDGKIKVLGQVYELKAHERLTPAYNAKQEIDAIKALIASSDTTLDSMQEVVNVIKQLQQGDSNILQQIYSNDNDIQLIQQAIHAMTATDASLRELINQNKADIRTKENILPKGIADDLSLGGVNKDVPKKWAGGVLRSKIDDLIGESIISRLAGIPKIMYKWTGNFNFNNNTKSFPFDVSKVDRVQFVFRETNGDQRQFETTIITGGSWREHALVSPYSTWHVNVYISGKTASNTTWRFIQAGVNATLIGVYTYKDNI